MNLQHVRFGFDATLLFNDLSLQLDRRERVCLVGRNGTGKTTLMKVINREIKPDAGERVHAPGIRIARLAQEVPEDLDGSVYSVVAGGLGSAGERLARFQEIGSGADLEKLQHALDADDAWPLEKRISEVISRLSLKPDASFAKLSGGMKRRAMLARGLASEPDLLLLDEPTNHLDIDSITWLEEFLLRVNFSILFVTHDRMFAGKLANRILELDRGTLHDHACDYATFLGRREARLEEEERHHALADKKLAEEEAWLRRGVRARRARNEGRVRALEKLREARRQRRKRVGTVRMGVEQGQRTGKIVMEVKNATFAYGDTPIIKSLTTTVLRQDRIGIIGANASGKTTLLRLLLRELKPTAGQVKHGTRLEIAYYDQLREQLDESRSVQQNVAGDRTTVMINGIERHVIGYLKGFLFSPERAQCPVSMLSGGERNRLLLARLFARPANVLVLDEPTNDLDTETLELLEAELVAFQGTVLLVSHDRAFLNNVVTRTLVLDGRGGVSEHAGGYDDWLLQRAPAEPPSATKPKPKASRARRRPRRITFKERDELAELPQKIEEMESEQARLHEEIADPAFYRQDGAKISEVLKRIEALKDLMAEAYFRWDELDNLASA